MVKAFIDIRSLNFQENDLISCSDIAPSAAVVVAAGDGRYIHLDHALVIRTAFTRKHRIKGVSLQFSASLKLADRRWRVLVEADKAASLGNPASRALPGGG